jgi:hypothetical protein
MASRRPRTQRLAVADASVWHASTRLLAGIYVQNRPISAGDDDGTRRIGKAIFRHDEQEKSNKVNFGRRND